jgi:hypothetical protein
MDLLAGQTANMGSQLLEQTKGSADSQAKTLSLS